MYLSKLRLWNFRKYGTDGVGDIETVEPGITIQFHKGVNVLIGENDSGKTAIIDAIRYTLHTQSGEPIYIDLKDFHESEGKREQELKIECIFEDLSDKEAAIFLEWLGVDKTDPSKCYLKIVLSAYITSTGRIYQQFKAGIGGDGNSMTGEVRDKLRVVYLKPLRDALQDMTHGYKSRLAQIMRSHKIFDKPKGDRECKHELEELYTSLATDVNEYFSKDDKPGNEIISAINQTLAEHFFLAQDTRRAIINLAGSDLDEILKQLDLVLEGNKSGLGSLNLLCIAAELLLLTSDRQGLRLTLIEEAEAHLHPQYQLRFIDYVSQLENTAGQFILTTHSNTLASNINLQNLILLKDTTAFPMSSDFTCCEEEDYRFLERFLDATKANLFFAKGVILVEGDAENLLIPTLAKIIGKDLHKNGVSIVNVGSTAYKRYVKIFQRKDMSPIEVKVAVVTDLDVRSIEYYEDYIDSAKKIVPCSKDFKIQVSVLSKGLIDTDGFPDFLTTKTEFEDYIRIGKKSKLNAKIRGDLETLFEQSKVEITTEQIEEMRTQKTRALTNLYTEYGKGEIKVFAPQKWTLEYDLAMSMLYKQLAIAVKFASFEKKGKLYSIHDSGTLKEISDEVVKEFSEPNSQTAYQIFKPLNDGTVSKAITAQYLSDLLLYINKFDLDKQRELFEDKTLVEVLETDDYLKYLLDAINHVTV